jgi:signal transduction histidine kinase
LTSSTGLQRWHGAPLHPDLQARFAVKAVLALKLCGETFTGHVFFLDMPYMSADDLVLGEIMARPLVADLDQFSIFQRLQQDTIIEERRRLARDLHDGVLQSLAGVGMQLQLLHDSLEKDPRAARQRVQELQRWIIEEQRDLRAFVQELRPAPPLRPGVDLSLPTRLEELRGRIEQQWGLRVELRLEGLESGLSRTLAHEIYQLISEGLVNAARHAQASAVCAELGVEETQVRITVADDGHGFPFQGRYDLPLLHAKGLGPKTLKERIAALEGSLAIDSTEAGARLDIILPRQRHGGYDAYSSGVS